MTHQLLERRVAPACRTHPPALRLRGRRRPVLALALTSVLSTIGFAGCADSENGRADTATETITARAPTIRNAVDDSGSVGFRVLRELRVGAEDGEMVFGRVADVAPR
ncbi:MAG: hypothetical protein ACWGON_09980, partial [Gemmatimonadota bacterium]